MNESDRPSTDGAASIGRIKRSVEEADKETKVAQERVGEPVKKLPSQSIAYTWEFFIPPTYFKALLALFVTVNAATVILFGALAFFPRTLCDSELTDRKLFNLLAVIILPLLAMSVGYYIGARSAARSTETEKPSRSAATPDRT
jgi:hypothetical protein